ncbi:hypothetical protein [Lederbergia citrea]|uniref:hypothetical protein n=1 Tax=Lederbergia citrea TaxID=2833581 RepID=UPI001BCA5CE3|nr:hypothetical protein [Lederbergia citrea]MBS4202751.1 hypothetical protein [Lederbergia citrea]
MAFQLKKKQLAIAAVAVFASFFLLFLLYYQFYKPAALGATLKENELKTERQMLEILENRIENAGTDTIISTMALQRKIPVKPLADQFVLDLDKAETMSGVLIKEIDFTNEEVINEEEESDRIETDGTEETDPLHTNMPAGLEKISADLKVEAKNYSELRDFLQQLESMERITQVEKISIKGPKEVTFIEDTSTAFTFETTISAYYMRDLDDLADQVPKVDAPTPADKEDPFGEIPTSEKSGENGE